MNTKEKLSRDPRNSVWYSNQKQKCDSCGIEYDWVIEFKLPEGEVLGRFCIHCAFPGKASEILKNHPELDYILMRDIEYKKGIQHNG